MSIYFSEVCHQSAESFALWYFSQYISRSISKLEKLILYVTFDFEVCKYKQFYCSLLEGFFTWNVRICLIRISLNKSDFRYIFNISRIILSLYTYVIKSYKQCSLTHLSIGISLHLCKYADVTCECERLSASNSWDSHYGKPRRFILCLFHLPFFTMKCFNKVSLSFMRVPFTNFPFIPWDSRKE